MGTKMAIQPYEEYGYGDKLPAKLPRGGGSALREEKARGMFTLRG